MCTRSVNTSSPAKTVHTRPYNGRVWTVYTARPLYVYTTRVHDCVRAVCTDVFGRVHGAYTRPVHGTCTRPCTGRAHDTYTAPYTCLRVQGPCTRPCTGHYTAENGRLHRHTRRCNVSCIRPCAGRIASCSRQCTGRVHGRFWPCTLAMYTVVFGLLHRAYTAV